MKECWDVLCHNYVDLASIYQILPQIRIRTGSRYVGSRSDPTRIHQIHRISGRIRIWIRCTIISVLFIVALCSSCIEILYYYITKVIEYTPKLGCAHSLVEHNYLYTLAVITREIMLFCQKLIEIN